MSEPVIRPARADDVAALARLAHSFYDRLGHERVKRQVVFKKRL